MNNDNTEMSSSIFRAPLTKSELHSHVVTVGLLLARQLHFVFLRSSSDVHEKAQAMLLGLDSTDGMNMPDETPGREGGELSYEHLANSALAGTMDELYNFAYHGMMFSNGYDMNSESSPAWISMILVDLSRSHFASEWHEYSPCLDAIKALQSVCETAEARMTLEKIQDGDTFMGWYGYEGHEGLTFRQMALLSGMSDASLRTLANPKRNNPLKTQSNGRNTYIDCIDAKAWLISKGRYVPLTDTDVKGAQLDLANESITSLDELQDRMDSRLHFLLGSDEGADTEKALASIRSTLLGKRIIDQTPFLNLSDEDMADSGLMRKIANALRLPAELLTLKVAHLRAIQQAQALQRRFEEAIGKAPKSD